MNHYDTYKPSGIDWIGDVPSHWEVKKIKYSCKFYGRIGFRGYTQADLVEESEGAITLSPSNMKEMDLDFRKCSYLSWKKYYESPEIIVRPGDVLLVKTASVGKCSYVSFMPKECTINPQILVLKEHKDYSKFIAYLFHTPIGQSYLDCNKVGSTIPTISEEKIGKFEFAFPPLSEQEAIAAYLDKRCGEIDKVITTQERRIELLREMKQSIITRAVTKGINPNAPMKDSGVEWIGEVPEHWEVMPLKYLSSKIGDGLHGTPKYDSNGVAYFINGNNLKTVCIKFNENTYKVDETEYKKYRVKLSTRTLLISLNGTIGNVSYYQNEKIILSKSAGYIDLNIDVNKTFIRYFLLSKAARNQYFASLAGTTIGNLSLETLRNLKLSIPPLVEQQSIVAYIEKKTKALDAAITKAQREVELLRELKQATITEVVTGKRKVC